MKHKRKKNSRKSEYFISVLTCPECGNKFPIPRRYSQQRAVGHVKDIYCPFCNKVQKFTEGASYER